MKAESQNDEILLKYKLLQLGENIVDYMYTDKKILNVISDVIYYHV